MPAKGTKSEVALTNQSIVFEVFAEGEKLTIPEVIERVNEFTKARDLPSLSERTVRRSIEGLVTSGFLQNFGRQRNATLYGKLSTSFTTSEDKLINFAGAMVTVGEFFRLVVDPNEKPLQKRPKLTVTSAEMEHHIRRRLAFVAWSAGISGHNEQLKTTMKELHAIVTEYQHAANLLQALLDSPVWYEQYRDRIGTAVRKLQQEDPELWALVDAYVRGT